MDDLCLIRAIELLDYWQRDAKQQVDPNWEPTNWELDQKTSEDQFNMVAAKYMGGAEVGIPAEMRDAIQWAEEMKAKMKGGNG